MKGWTQIGTYVVPYKDEEYEVEVEGMFYESKEGQDADGNRGMWMTFCDDISITNITPTPPDDTTRRYIEEHIHSLNADDFTWDVGQDEPDEKEFNPQDEVPWDAEAPWDVDASEDDEDFGNVTAKKI